MTCQLRFALVVGAFVSGLALAMPASAQSTTSSSRATAPGTGSNCGTIELRPRGCANGAVATVDIPSGSRILEVHYYSTAGWPNDNPSFNEVDPSVEGGFGMFDPWQAQNLGGIMRVTAQYHNRSSNRNRIVYITVTWQ